MFGETGGVSKPPKKKDNYGVDTDTLFMIIIAITFIAAMGGGFSKSKDQRSAAWKAAVIILVGCSGLLVISEALFPGE